MVSVVIITKNEEKVIGACLDSVSWADERIIIDDYSTDKTVEIAKTKGARVYKHSLQSDFAKQRNIGLQKANNEWVLFLDADERVSHSLQYEITHAIAESLSSVQGFYIKRDDHMWGKKIRYVDSGSVVLLRLGRRRSGRWVGKVHESWQVEGQKEKLLHHLDHFPHPTIKEFLQEINFYTTIKSQELYKKGVRCTFLDVIVYPCGKFLLNYIFMLGFLDGVQGMIMAVMMSFHSFLVRGKLWVLTSHQKNQRK